MQPPPDAALAERDPFLATNPRIDLVEGVELLATLESERPRARLANLRLIGRDDHDFLYLDWQPHGRSARMRRQRRSQSALIALSRNAVQKALRCASLRLKSLEKGEARCFSGKSPNGTIFRT